MEFKNIRFRTKLVIREVEEDPTGDSWELEDPLVVSWHEGIITCEAGFVHDLSSIPRIFRSIIPVVGKQNRPSVVHDWLYVNQPEGWTRADADLFFLEAMQAVGVGWLRRNVMYLAVRAGGWTFWNY